MRLNIQTKYSLAGTAFGLCFPLAAWSLDLVLSNLAFSPASLILIHQNNYLHYIVDMAPVVLGLTFLFLGRFSQLTSAHLSEVKESADKALNLLNSTGEAIYGIDLKGNCTFANIVCLEMLGYKTESDLLGKNMHELIHHTRNDGTAYPVDECKIYRAFKEGKGSHVDDEVLWRVDGSSFDSEYRSIPIKRDNQIIGSVVSFTDITKRLSLERIEHDRLSNLIRYKEAMSNIVEISATIETEVSFEEIQKSILKIIANTLELERVSIWYYSDNKNSIIAIALYKRSEDAYEHGMELSSVDYPDYFAAIAKQTIVDAPDAANDPRTHELKDSYLKPLGIGAMLDIPIKIQGETIGVICLEHVGKIRRWNDSEKEFSTSIAMSLALTIESDSRIKSDIRHKVLLNTMADGLITIDDDGFIESFNPSAEKIFGYSSKEIIGRNITQLMPEILRSQHRKGLERYKETGELNILGTAGVEFNGIRKDGSTCPLAISISEMFIGDKRYFSGVVRDITDRKNLEMKHEQIGAELAQLIQTANAPIFGVNTRLQISDWNTAAETVTGYSADEVMHCLFVDEFVEDASKKEVRRIFEDALIGVETANFELNLRTKNGRISTVLFNSTTRRDLEGNIIGVIGIGQDITATKLAQVEVTTIARELSQLIDTANAPIFGIDTNGMVNEWNQEAASLIGFSKEEVLGHDLVQDFITDEFKESVKKVLNDALKGNQTSNYEFPLYTKGGKRVELRLNAATRHDLDGNITGVVGIGQDITDTKIAQAESERIALELTQLVNTVNAPIFGIDSRGLINQWNKQAEQISGYSKEEAVGRDMVHKVIAQEHREKIRVILTKAMAGEDSSNSEIIVSHRDGSTRLLLLNATAQRDIDGKVTGVIIISQDITELREKENALNQAQKMEAVGQLTGGIAHDFNNLLSIISGNLRFLQQDIGEVSTEIQELFEDAMSAADDGAELTQRLLSFSRTKALKLEVENVNQLIEKFSRFISRALGENIELKVELPEDDLFINVDPSQLENALLNLSINARDAMPRGGSITISAARFHNGDSDLLQGLSLSGKDWVRISVADTGTGISTNDIDHVFEPFFTTKEVGKGSGLGLSMVYGFVQQSSGECFIESEPGKGTTVSMYLCEAPAGTYIHSQSHEDDLTLRGSEVILVVEDEPRVRRVTLRDLRKFGYKTLEAENADVAKTIIESGEHIDMLFSDVLMPGEMDGHMLALWTEKHYPNIKIVLTSGYSKGKGDVDSERTHPIPMIRKPYTIKKLAKRIRTTFSEG